MALAEHVAGTEADFVALMNRTAAALGLRATHFINAHGMDAAGQTTSATDLLAISRAALKYPFFGDVVASAHAEVAGQA